MITPLPKMKEEETLSFDVENRTKYRNYIEFLPFDQTLNSYRITYSPSKYTLTAGEKIVCVADSVEFPPLEHWNHPFWRNLRENMPAEGVEVRLRFLFPHPGNENTEIEDGKEIPFETVIRIKPRCEAEMKQIQSWYQSTPQKFYPEVNFTMKSWSQKWEESALDSEDHGEVILTGGFWEVAKTWEYPIWINCENGKNGEYSPWFFMRVGNRKPFGKEIPRNLTEWRTLEESWTLGTMRDEMKMTRLVMETYGKIPFFRKNPRVDEMEIYFIPIMDWLKTLPEIQKAVLFTTIRQRFCGPRAENSSVIAVWMFKRYFINPITSDHGRVLP